MIFSDKKWRWVWGIIGLGFLFLGLIFRSTDSFAYIISLLITIVFSGIAISYTWNKFEENSSDNPMQKPSPSTTELTNENENSFLFLTVSGTLYAVIAGFAIISMLEFSFTGIIAELKIETGDNLATATISSILLAIQNSYYEIFMGLAFLATAIPFYHGAMLFLSDKSRILLEEDTKKLSRHFFTLFTQAIIFLGISLVLDSFVFVIVLLLALMFVDSIWLSITQNMKKPPPKGWIFLNLGFVAALFLTIYPGWEPITSAALLLLICSIRAGVDYVAFEPYYFKKKS